MNVVMLFEDNEKSASSRLLKAGYNGKHIKFSGGYNKLKNKLEESYNNVDIFIVFIDVAPNNPFTVQFYESFLRHDYVKSVIGRSTRTLSSALIHIPSKISKPW